MIPMAMPAPLRWARIRRDAVHSVWKMRSVMHGSSPVISEWMIGVGRNMMAMRHKAPFSMPAFRVRDYGSRFEEVPFTLIFAQTRGESGHLSRQKFAERVQDSAVRLMDEINSLRTEPERVKESRNRGISIPLRLLREENPCAH